MKSKFTIVLVTLFSTLFVGNSFASWSYSISSDYTPGDATAEFTLNFSTIDQAATLYSYDLGFIFDSSELTYISHEYENLNGIIAENYGQTSIEDGFINSFNAGTWSLSPGLTVEANTTVALGNILFQVSNSAIADNLTDFDFNYDYNLFKTIVDMVDVAENETNFPHHLTDVAAVPIPSALFLIYAGLLGLAGIRRK